MANMARSRGLARLCQWGLKLEKGSWRVKISIPSLGDLVNRQGVTSHPELLSLLALSRNVVSSKVPENGVTTFLEFDKMMSDPDRSLFIAAIRTWYARDALLTPTSPRFAIQLELADVGTSSFNTRARLLDDNTGVVIADNSIQCLTVGRNGKPIPLPDWWVAKYRTWVSLGAGKLVVPGLEEAQPVHRYHVRVVWDNTSDFGHTFYVNYLRFCYDAAMDAMQHGHLDNFRDDICYYETKETRMSYRNQSMAGDDLVVSVWPNKHNPFTLHFNITKGSVSLYQCTIDFYEPPLN